MLYAKEGPSRYISHLDLLRAFERSARRAGLPLAFTQGFNPHPKVAFAAPLGVGTAGEAEYADLELAADVPAGEVLSALSGAMPEGLRLIEVRSVPEALQSLMAMVDRATYRVEGKLAHQVSIEELDKAITTFLSAREILVKRQSKTGEKRVQDIKPFIFAMSGRINGDIMLLEAELKTGSRGNVRIEELLTAFEESSRLPVQGSYTFCRTGLYSVLDNEKRTLW